MGDFYIAEYVPLFRHLGGLDHNLNLWAWSIYPISISLLQDFVQLPPVDFNDKLRLASSWFGMCGISAQLSPVPGGAGIQLLQADGFDLHSFHTLTGTTFMMVTESNTQEATEILKST